MVFWSLRKVSRACRSSLFSASSMARSKRPMYHASEYWYIGSMLAMSVMQKKRSDARKAAGS